MVWFYLYVRPVGRPLQGQYTFSRFMNQRFKKHRKAFRFLHARRTIALLGQ